MNVLTTWNNSLETKRVEPLYRMYPHVNPGQITAKDDSRIETDLVLQMATYDIMERSSKQIGRFKQNEK